MTKQTIWYLHPYAGAPSLGMSYRPYYLSQTFNQHGFKTYIITPDFHHVWTNAPKLNNQPVELATIDNVPYIFIKTNHYIGNGLKRIQNMLSYAFKLYWYEKKLVNLTGKPSHIIVSSAHPFHFFSAYMTALRYDAKLIFEVRDLWPQSLIDLLRISPHHPLIKTLAFIEKFAYQKADATVSLLPFAKAYMMKKGLSEEKFHYISNGFDNQNSPILMPQSMQKSITTKKNEGCCLVGYTGAHGIPNALDDLLYAIEYLKQHKQDTSFHFFLLGKGNEKERLIALAKRLNLTNISFFDPIERDALPDFLSAMDVLYIGWKNKPLYAYGISPNKLFEYMHAGKPILHAILPYPNITDDTHSGLTVEAENPTAIAKGLLALYELPEEKRLALGKNGQHAIETTYHYDNLAKQYLSLLTQLTCNNV